MAAANAQPNQQERDQITKFGTFGIVFGLVFPPAGVLWATRCLREAGRRNVGKTLAYTSWIFVLVGLVVWSVVFAILTRDFPLNVDR